MILADYRRAVLNTEDAWRTVLDAVTDGRREDIDNSREEFLTAARKEADLAFGLQQLCDVTI